MFFVTYLRRELRRRLRQTLVIALGLALGVGLVITVTAASSGVQKAQSGVLRSLYGVGTDVTATGKPPSPSANGGTRVTIGQGGSQVCNQGSCQSGGGQTIDNLTSSAYGPLSATSVASIAKQPGVVAAAGGLTLTDRQLTIPAASGGGTPSSNSFGVQGVDLAHADLGPLSDGRITSGRGLGTSDASSNVAVVDANYAVSNQLHVGSPVTVAKTPFTVIGITTQPQGSKPPDVYIPLQRAQALGTSDGQSLAGDVNTIYVTAASAARIPAVQQEISKALPAANVTTSSSLASQVTGSLASTATLANDLGRWLSVLVLIAAFAVAALLTMSAVTRRVREFGTLKALGWRSRRIVAQVMGESVVTGVLGGAVGVALGFAGAAVISLIAPQLSATVTTASGQRVVTPAGAQSSSVAHTVSVPMSASVTLDTIVLALVLAIAGGIVAGAFGGWRAATMRPADALRRVE